MLILAMGGSLLTGCVSKKTTTDTTAPAASVPASTASEQTTEAPVPAGHKVEVTDQSVTTLKDDQGTEYKTIIPKLTVDGKDADSINAALSDHIKKNHVLTQEEDNDGDTKRILVDGETTRYAWGVRGNIVSIVIIASETFTDGTGYEIFNYNVDTLQAAGKDEVIKACGMTPDEFYKKVADAYRAYWKSEEWLQEDMSYLDKSIGAISQDNVTPFILNNGNAGAAGLIYTDSQFPESIKCFDLNTLKAEYFSKGE